MSKELERIERELKDNVIRTAHSRQNPQNTWRPGKEITYDSTGSYVLKKLERQSHIKRYSLDEIEKMKSRSDKNKFVETTKKKILEQIIANPRHAQRAGIGKENTKFTQSNE